MGLRKTFSECPAKAMAIILESDISPGCHLAVMNIVIEIIAFGFMPLASQVGAKTR